MWQLIPGGPHVEDLQKDDIIFNTLQTADLIRTGRTARSGKLVAHAKGTVPGMSAFAKHVDTRGNGALPSNGSNSGGGGNGGSGGGNNGGDSKKKKKKSSNKKTKTKTNAFQKYIEKLFDWIEVRLDRIQRKIDLFTQKAENAVANLNASLSTAANINATIDAKNSNINSAMAQIRELIDNNAAGQKEYSNEANRVLDKAEKTTIKKKVKKKGKTKTKKTKLLTPELRAEIEQKVKDGSINIGHYSKEVQEVINEYKEWYDKSLDCLAAQEELQAQLKELQQTKLDNITEHYEAWAGYADAVKQSSEATTKLLEMQGYAGNSKQSKDTYDAQLKRQEEMTNLYREEWAKYNAELLVAKGTFGENSVQFKNAQTALENINKQLIESQTAEYELKDAIFELDVTFRSYVIDRLKAAADKLSSLVSLTEKRGKNPTLGYKGVQESDYANLITGNEDIIRRYQEQIDTAKRKIKQDESVMGNKEYEEQHKIITDSESAILSLLSANEDLKQSIRTLRWKPYEELQEKLKRTSSDLDHIESFIREDELLDVNGQITERGYAQMAIYAEQMQIAEREIANAEEAMKKLDAEYKSGEINLDQFNEGMKTQTDIVQDASSSLYDYKTKLADLYIKQITKENDLLQELIDKRKEALQQKQA